MTDSVKISSTRLGRYIDCPRKARLAYDGEKPPSRKMAWGTVFHAVVEFRLGRGRWPTRKEFWKLEGNYEDPRQSEILYPGLLKEVLDLYGDHEPLLAIIDELRSIEDMVVEQPMADWDLRLGSEEVLATGYYDVLVPSQRLIVDWKTRSNFRYAPKTSGDFRDNDQLMYYAAALVQRNPEWPSVTVRHVNVLRETAAIVVYESEIPAFLLKSTWKALGDKWADEYARAMRADPGDVPTDTSACYKYGPCAWLQECNRAGFDSSHSIFDFEFDFGD